MKDNKNAPLRESIYNQDILSITENLDYNNVLNNMPEILNKTAVLLQERFNNMSVSCILNCLLVKTAQMITSKRITLKAIENDSKNIIPNWYSIIFMPSGYGKDLLSNNLDDYIFHNFREAFKQKAINYKYNEEERIQQEALKKYPEDKKESLRISYIKTEIEKIRNLIPEMTNGTQEGFYCDCKAFENAGFGSVFLKFSEFGNDLKSLTTEKEQFINCLFSAYDGRITSKCIKGSNREQDIENMPVNVLMYSDYTYFKSDIKDLFYKLMNTGIGRRSVVSFQAETILKYNDTNAQKESLFFNEAEKINKSIYAIYCNIKENSCYIVDKTVYDNIYVKYNKHTIDKYNNCDDDLLKKEIQSRPYKVLKISCLYASLNHPETLIIQKQDMIQAIRTIEFLSKDLKAFSDYKPVKKDNYDNVFNFFYENINKPIKKSDLKTNHFKTFGFSRRIFDSNFENIINLVSEIADTKGYLLQEEKVSNSTTYKLTSLKKEESNSKTVDFNILISPCGKSGKSGK